jgi:transposase
LVIFALLCNYILNCIFYDFYKERMLKEDLKYLEYKTENKTAAAQIIQWSMITTF